MTRIFQNATLQKYQRSTLRLSIITLGVLFVCMAACHSEKKRSVFQNNSPEREAITFILGDDTDFENPFYRKAALYYRFNEKDKTEKVITHCQSLVEVQEYLVANAGHRPWGLINLVSHGNHYLGLRARITPEGKRASLQNLQESIANGTFKKLPAKVIDEATTIVLHSCGLGKNPAVGKAIASAFSNQETVPKVVTSPYFEYYVSDESKERDITRHFADFWTTSYKMGYKPSKLVLARRLANTYPESDVNWEEALSKEQGTTAGEVFHYTFDIPVKWVFPYDSKEAVPKLESNKSKLQWVSQNPKIRHDLQNLNIAPEKFNWWMRSVYIKNDDGSTTPALWVKGYCTMLCVLQLLPQEKG